MQDGLVKAEGEDLAIDGLWKFFAGAVNPYGSGLYG